MLFSANRLELLSAVRDAERIAPSQSPLEVLQCAFLSAENGKVTVAAGNLELALERRVAAEITEEGCVVISAELLSNMLRLMDGEIVTFEQKNSSTVSVVCGETAYELSVLDAAQYPRMEIPFPEDTVSVTGIPAMTRRTAFAVSVEEEKPLMKCVHLIFSTDGLRAVGSDGYRIAAAQGDSRASGSVDMLIPATSLEKLTQLIGNKDTLQVGTTGKTVVFLKDDFAFSARLVMGEYFDADQLLRRVTPSFSVLTDAESLRHALESVCTVSGRQNRFSITFQGNRIRMRCESENGASSVEVDVVPLTGTPAGTFWYGLNKLQGCLRAQSGTMTLELAQNGALLMRTDELTCMQIATREPKPIERKPVKTATEAKTKGKKRTEKKAALPAAA